MQERPCVPSVGLIFFFLHKGYFLVSLSSPQHMLAIIPLIEGVHVCGLCTSPEGRGSY